MRIIGRPLISASVMVPGPAYKIPKKSCKQQVPNSQKLVTKARFNDSLKRKLTYFSNDAITSSHPFLHLLLESSYLHRHISENVAICSLGNQSLQSFSSATMLQESRMNASYLDRDFPLKGL